MACKLLRLACNHGATICLATPVTPSASLADIQPHLKLLIRAKGNGNSRHHFAVLRQYPHVEATQATILLRDLLDYLPVTGSCTMMTPVYLHNHKTVISPDVQFLINHMVRICIALSAAYMPVTAR